jgi:hypothetical protein
MSRRPKPEPTVSIRLYASTVKKIRQLAIASGRDPADWFAECFGDELNKKHRKALERELKGLRDKPC